MKSIEELNAVKEKTLARLNGNTVRIVVGMATCGIAAGAKPVFDALKEETEKRGLENVVVSQTGCIGMCKYEPLVDVYVPGHEKVTYVFVSPEKARRIIDDHIVGGQIAEDITVASVE